MAHRKIKRKLAGFVSNISPYIVGVVIGLIFLAICSAFCSCSPCERLARKCPPIEYVRDSIVVYDTFTRETTITDTLLYVRLIPEFVYLRNPVMDTARGETSFTRGMAWVDGEIINLTLVNKDSAEVLVQRIKTLERQVNYWRKISENVKVKTAYRTRGIVKVGAWIGLIAAVYVLVRILMFVLRKL